MGPIFRISGNFADGGEWRKTDPHYEGSIIVTPKNNVLGLASLQTGGDQQTRFMYGKIIPSQKDEKFLMLMMLSANDPENTLLISVIDASRDEEGQWAPIILNEEKHYMDCCCRGRAGFCHDGEDYSPLEYRRIKYSFFYHLSKSRNDYNQRLIKAMEEFGKAYISY